MIDLNQRTLEKKNFFNRLILIYVFFLFLFVFFLYRTFSLQVSNYTDYEIASLQNKTREVLIQPMRGIIYDRNGEIIVNNTPSYNLITKPSQIKDLESHFNKISMIISLSEEDITYARENFNRKARLNRELILKKNLTLEEIARFESRKYRFPDTFIDERYSRKNLYPELFSHSIGYVGNMSDDSLEEVLSDQNLKPKETIFIYSNGYLTGKTGLENTYDDSLRGLYGKKIYEVDASGKLLKELKIIPATNGKDLHTSLDINSQKVAFKQLNNRRGAVVAVEIDTGAIVTYISSPSFSVNQITNGMSSKDFSILINNKDKPFFDRAGQGRYSPASTIKPAIGLYGLENNIIDWDFTMDDPGFFILPEDNRLYRGWKKGGHGKINLKDAIIESSNTFFFSLAYESEIENLIEHLSHFGFGRNICLDCFIPDQGLLPSPEWKMNNLNFSWFKGDTVNLGVGQGYLSATPLQLAYYSSFLANKGNLNKFSFIQENNEMPKDIFVSSNINNKDWKNIHESMIGVIENPKGTAGRLRKLKDFTVAAKSGTVELVSTETKEDYKIIREEEGKRDHAIIIAFAPIPNPKYAISVVIENGESGGSVAGPVAIEILNSLIKNE
ncbi:MAG: penicillin-binding protein 2 [Gammaproteobacteria bacterium TMED226]|nr:MAG: penicillin-binding protein 2 [Gammaproteobacteria bacterium TMED226]|tara:strand:- start:2208 stop:4049 length:1842 start_codon:yes stop_codon:yes gene_type:complete